MRGYPKVIATKQDFVNLLETKEFRSRALKDLNAVVDLNDSTVTRAIVPKDSKNPDGEWETETIKNPNPRWKQLGFESRDEVR